MAEYIDRDKLKKHLDIEISFGGLENKLLVFDKIDTCDTADVIEREKIDKAIEEIEGEYSTCNQDWINGLNRALDILKRNIGE